MSEVVNLGWFGRKSTDPAAYHFDTRTGFDGKSWANWLKRRLSVQRYSIPKASLDRYGSEHGTILKGDFNVSIIAMIEKY